MPTAAYGAAGALGWAGAERLAGVGPRPALEGSRRIAPDPIRTSPNALPPDTEAVVPSSDPKPVRSVTVVPIVAGVDARRPVVGEPTVLPQPVAEPVPVESGSVRVGSSTEVGQAERVPRLTVAGVATPPVDPGRPTDPPPVVRSAEPTAVYPTGIVVQSEPGVYRSGGQFKVDEYVRFPEPQVDANGEETWTPLYHAKAKVR